MGKSSGLPRPRRRDDERGAVVVIVVLSLIAMLGMIVLTVDVGGLLLARRAMVNGADAAALAAAKTCTTESDSSLPEDQADLFAMDNVDGLVAEDGGVTEISNCHPPDNSNGVGYVTVQYSKPQQLFFAPVLGFDSNGSVTTAATAEWGPLGGGQSVPIVLDSGTLQTRCKIPDDIEIGTECNIYYNNGDAALGDADWGFMNLDEWNVEKDFNCSSAGASQQGDWIRNDSPNTLMLNGDPPGSLPTYVCNDTGHTNVNWERDLEARRLANPILLFPVNDCAHQVDKDGVEVPCPGTPDKYDVIGFAKLFLVKIYDGKDPVAVGTPGTAAQSGDCGPNGVTLSLDVNGQNNLAALADSNCGAPKAADEIPYASISVTNKVGPVITPFKKCLPGAAATDPTCDYEYDASTKLLTGRSVRFLLAARRKVTFEWTVYGTPPTDGLCGNHLNSNGQGDPNAICLEMKWLGKLSSAGPPTTGKGFGVFGYVLCDRTLETCPDQGG